MQSLYHAFKRVMCISPRLLGALIAVFLVLSSTSPSRAQSWSLIAPAGPLPVPRDISAAVYSSASNRLILFGGYPHVTPYTNDLWILSDANGLGTPTWTQVIPNGAPGSPQARAGAVMVYDAQNNRAILAGGESAFPALANLNDVWVLINADGTTGNPTWTQLNPQGGFPGREDAGAVYDAQSNRLIVFMGVHPGGLCRPTPCIVDPADVWVLTNANGLGGTPVWNQLSASGAPPGRSYGSVDQTYDPVNNRVMVFGGLRPAQPQVLNDVWVLTNANGLGNTPPTWTQLSPSGSLPAARLGNTAFYDVQTNRLVIFGGSNEGVGGPLTNFNDTWALDNANGLGGTPVWNQFNPNGLAITPHVGSSGLYDSARNRMILFGGGVNGFVANETWVLSNANGTVSSALAIQNISPSQGGNAGSVTMQIVGTGFQNGVNVKLTGSGPDIVGANTTVQNLSVITTTFDLTGASPGLRDVVLTNPDSTSATAAGSFTIEQGGSPQIWVDIVGRDRLKIGTMQTFYIAYGNRGNVDAFGAPIWIQVPSEVEISLGFNLAPVSNGLGLMAQQSGSIPYQVTVGNTTLAGFLPPVVAAGSTGILPVILRATGSIAQFPLQVFIQPTYFTTSVAQNPQQAGLCAADVYSLAAGIIGGPQVGAVATALNSLLHLQVLGATPARGTLSLIQFYNILNQNVSGINVLSPLALATLAGLPTVSVPNNPNLVSAYTLFSDCGPFTARLGRNLLVQLTTSSDPNDKVGLQGVGSFRYVTSGQSFLYQVSFTNLPTATASAQTVSITDQLDTANFNLSTFSLGPITFGNAQVAAPPNSTSFNTTVDLRPSDNLLVGISAALNQGNGLVTWRFTSLDPLTGRPPTDPSAGFLPPDLVPPQGEGSVFFSVMPKNGLPTNTQIQNQATIVFDVNAPMSTPTWLNTLDNTAPKSQVTALPATETTATFTLNWSGSDFGSGIATFTVYVSDDGVPFTAFQSNTTATSAVFTGQAGHTYGFYSIATDAVGNVESAKTTAEATTQVVTDTTPPVTTANATPAPNAAGWDSSNVTVTLNSTDNEPGGTGVKQIQWSLAGAQTGSSTVPANTTTVTISTEGITTLTYFGTDNVGNVETAKTLTVNIDKTPPVITASANPSVLWPPNGKMVDVTVSGTMADNLSGLDPSTAAFVVQDSDGIVQPRGHVSLAPNGTYSFTISLEARRDGQDQNGRLYTIVLNAQDNAGNASSASTTVIVPHNQAI